MLDKDKLKYIKQKDIDFNKWDRCIIKSVNGLVYAYSWYLDIVSPDWDALVYGDYEIVMPLTLNKKFGFKYLYQPFFTQQLGVFSSSKIDDAILKLFLESILTKYKFIDINLNKYNKPVDSDKFTITNRVTYELDLIEDYSAIYAKYSDNHKRNLKKARQNKLSVIQGLMPNEVFNLVSKNIKIPNLGGNNINMLRQLIAAGIRKNLAYLYGVYDKNNMLVAAAYFIRTRDKVCFILSVSSEEGKALRAMFLVIDTFIKDFAGRNLTLDFEGSNIDGIARFYRGFGANKFIYSNIRVNRLPFPINLLKGK